MLDLLVGDVFEGSGDILTLLTDPTKTITVRQATVARIAGFATLDEGELDTRGLEYVSGKEYTNKANVFKDGICYQLKDELRTSSDTWVVSEWNPLTAVI
jgi:hypothetical protein